MIFSGHLVLPNGPRSCRLAPGWIEIRDGRIAAVHEEAAEMPRQNGAGEPLISPGFIDAHMHLPQIDALACGRSAAPALA